MEMPLYIYVMLYNFTVKPQCFIKKLMLVPLHGFKASDMHYFSNSWKHLAENKKKTFL